MFGKSKPLWDQDPKNLDLETLSTMHTALMAKLILANQELRSRMEGIAEASAGLPNSGPERETLMKKAQELKGFDLILRQLVAGAVKQIKG